MTSRRWHGGELRWDHWSREWVVLAPGRTTRPADGPDDADSTDGACPFCPGAAEDTPPESWRLPGSDGAAWRVRAVPNRHGLSDHHEVVIESPRHDWDLALSTDHEVADVLFAWQQRHRALRAGAAQVVVFRNRGQAAGVSLHHPHSQVVGLPVLSATTRHRLESMHEYDREHGRRLSDDLLAGELTCGERVVLDEEHTIAFVPFASTVDFEVHLVPKMPRADFAAVAADELLGIAHALRAVLAALHQELDDPAYNLVLHTAPTGWEHAHFLSWSLTVLPRLTAAAGLELATGIPVLRTTPEHAATRLRCRLGHLPTIAASS